MLMLWVFIFFSFLILSSLKFLNERCRAQGMVLPWCIPWTHDGNSRAGKMNVSFDTQAYLEVPKWISLLNRCWLLYSKYKSLWGNSVSF